MPYTVWRGGEKMGELVAVFSRRSPDLIAGLFKPTVAFDDIEPSMQVRTMIPGRGRPVSFHRVADAHPGPGPVPLTRLTPEEERGLPVAEQLLVRDAEGAVVNVRFLHIMQESVSPESGEFPDLCRAHGIEDSAWVLMLAIEPHAPDLETERTVLTPFAESDTEGLLNVFQDPAVRRYLLDNVMVAKDWVEKEIAGSTERFTQSSIGLWSVRHGTSGSIIGFVGFREFFDPPQLQLIYGLLPEHWGQGIATEVAMAARDYAFRGLGFSEVRAAIDVPNDRSGRVLERLGMTPDRTTDEGVAGTTHYVIDHLRWLESERSRKGL